MRQELRTSKRALRRASKILLPVCFLGLLVVAEVAQAEEQEPLPFSLDYTHPQGCPELNDAFQMIRKRSRRVRLTQAENTQQHLLIQVTQTTTGFQGALTVTRNEQATDSRLIQGTTCAEVVDALALTAALSLDPEASVVGTTETNDNPDDPQVKGGANANDSDRSGKNSDDEVNQEKGADKRANRGDGSQASGSAEPPSWHLSAGLQGSIERVMDTSWHVGMGLTAGLRHIDDRVWFPFEFAMDLRYLTEVASTENELVSRLALARFSYCLLRFGDTVTLLACPTAQLGLLVVQGENLETTQAVNRLYAAAGLQARLRTRLYQNLEGQLVSSLSLPFVPRHFAVDPGPTVIGSTTPVAFDAAIALNWVF